MSYNKYLAETIGTFHQGFEDPPKLAADAASEKEAMSH